MAKGKGKKKNSGSAGQNRKESEAFLEQNSCKDNIFETASGLQYEVIKEEKGRQPTEFDAVKVNQRAMLLGGKVLDDTYKTGIPLEFKLTEVIEGYAEGLQLMSVGSRYRFYVAPDLAWGRKGSTSGKIGPSALVIFDVALLEIL